MAYSEPFPILADMERLFDALVMHVDAKYSKHQDVIVLVNVLLFKVALQCPGTDAILDDTIMKRVIEYKGSFKMLPDTHIRGDSVAIALIDHSAEAYGTILAGKKVHKISEFIGEDRVDIYKPNKRKLRI